jgi:RNA polymerase sigma factor (sigma-70 family)
MDALAISDGSSPEMKAMGHELHARLAAALEQLPDDMRELLQTRVIDGLDYREIARRTGRTEGALRVHYVRALRKLRELLDR